MYVIPPTTSTAMIVKMDCITQKIRSLAGKKMKKPRGVKCNYNDRFKLLLWYNEITKEMRNKPQRKPERKR